MNSKDKVAVTGVTGHIGYVLVNQLIARGYPVRAIARDVSRARMMFEKQVPGLEIFEADVLDKQKLEKALEGVAGLFHLAAVFNIASPDPQKEIIEVNINGTKNALHAAYVHKIKKIVYTSSLAAVGPGPDKSIVKNDKDWNFSTNEPYAKSKVLSEQEAWSMAKACGLNMVTALPGTILGPDFFRLTPSLGLIKSGLTGEFPLAPPLEFNFVDVRDIAEAHIRLYENEKVSGRYLLGNETMTVIELYRLLKEIKPDLKVPNREMPLWFAKSLPYLDAFSHAVLKTPVKITREFVDEYIGKFIAVDCEKSRREIQWSPRPFRQTLTDTVQWMEEKGLV